jgi:type II secretory pathway pseudopilin PulG
MGILFGIAIGAVLLTVVLYVVLMQVRVRQMKQANQLLDEYQEENILAYTTSANYLGIESAGMGQVRGNGFLMLTSSFLLLERMAPKHRLQIPLRKIFRVDQVSSFLGRRNIKPILRISFTNDEGEQDTLGILLKDPDKWQQLIHAASEQARKFV